MHIKNILCPDNSFLKNRQCENRNSLSLKIIEIPHHATENRKHCILLILLLEEMKKYWKDPLSEEEDDTV